MRIDISKIGGIGEYKVEGENYMVNEKAFLVLNEKTAEVRTDRNLAKFLKEKYESVMDSRYFGSRGIEMVLSGQISEDEVNDLIRLSYNLTKDMD